MKQINFSLRPFQTNEISRDYLITGKIGRKKYLLTILYELSGPLDNLAITPTADNPTRMERLWEKTCFELFLKFGDSDPYWEFNLSPSGDWNVYRFSAYREGMQEERAFIDLPFSLQTGQDRLGVDLNVNIEKILQQDITVNAAVSAVLKSKSGDISFWALTHKSISPDFHSSEGFLIEL